MSESVVAKLFQRPWQLHPPCITGRPSTPEQIIITVLGCSNVTVSKTIQGVYRAVSSYRDKPVYRKDGPGALRPFIFYWERGDGARFKGWWFGSEVGGEQVFQPMLPNGEPICATSCWLENSF